MHLTEMVLDEITRESKAERKKSNFIRLLKFYLLPGWRDPKFTEMQYKIEMIKSKRRLFRRLLTPLTLVGLGMVLFIAILAVFAPWLTPFTIDELAVPYIPPGGTPFDDPSNPFYIVLIGVVISVLIQWVVFRSLKQYCIKKNKKKAYIWIFRCFEYEAIINLIIAFVITNNLYSLFPLGRNDHPLGTTKSAYDLLGRIIWGARTTLTIAAIPVIISLSGGIVGGTISAYFGGWVDTILMRFVDFMYSFPTIILVIIITPMLGGKLTNMVFIWGLLFIPSNMRFVRSLVLQVKQNIYVTAAITGGADKVKVMFKHVFPNAISSIIISLFGAMAFSVLGFASIAFLGLGDETFADWGTDILYSRARMTAIGQAFFPGLFIGITAIGFILLGDGLRDALDPRLKI